MSKKFNKLTLSPHWQQYFSKYPQGYTIIENLIDWLSQVNKMVDSYNELTTHVDNFKESVENTTDGFRLELDTFLDQFDDNLKNEVSTILGEWQQSGFLDIVIDSALETKYHEMDERLTTELAQTDGKLNSQPRLPSKAYASIIYDDGYIWDYEMVFPLFKSKSVVGASALISSYVGNRDNMMNINQINEMKEYGWEFLAHTVDIGSTELVDLTKSQQDYQLRESKKQLEAMGLTINGFVYPNNAYNEDTLELIRKYYQYAVSKNDRTGKVDMVNHAPFNQYALYRVTFEQQPHVFKRYVDEAIEKGGWLLVMGHSNNYTVRDFPERDWGFINTNLDYLISSGISIKTPSEVIKDKGNVVTIGDKVYTEDNLFISKTGKIDSNYHAIEKNDFDVKIDTPPTSFPEGLLTTTHFLDAEAQGFPENRGGRLETFHSDKSVDLDYQIYYVRGSNRVYKRYWDRTITGTWTPFKNISTEDYELDLAIPDFTLSDTTIGFDVNGHIVSSGKTVYVNMVIEFLSEGTGAATGLTIRGLPPQFLPNRKIRSLLTGKASNLKEEKNITVATSTGSNGGFNFLIDENTDAYLSNDLIQAGSKIELSGQYLLE